MNRVTRQLLENGLRQVTRDGMLLVLLPAPFLAGIALRSLLPLADSWLVSRAGWSLTPYYGLADACLLALAPLLLAMVSAFLLLDERDEGIGAYYAITPAGGRPYLIARLGLPLLWALVCTWLVGALFGMSGADAGVIAAASLISALQGTATALFLATVAGNKVEGLALSKLAGMFLLGLPAAWFLPVPWRWLLGWLPSLWMGELLHTGLRTTSLCLGLGSGLVWLAVLAVGWQRRSRF